MSMNLKARNVVVYRRVSKELVLKLFASVHAKLTVLKYVRLNYLY
jgi:hypothetical protein